MKKRLLIALAIWAILFSGFAIYTYFQSKAYYGEGTPIFASQATSNFVFYMSALAIPLIPAFAFGSAFWKRSKLHASLIGGAILLFNLFVFWNLVFVVGCMHANGNCL